jgi:hypothetical protein
LQAEVLKRDLGRRAVVVKLHDHIALEIVGGGTGRIAQTIGIEGHADGEGGSAAINYRQGNRLRVRGPDHGQDANEGEEAGRDADAPRECFLFHDLRFVYLCCCLCF